MLGCRTAAILTQIEGALYSASKLAKRKDINYVKYH
jgi:hypothetical protein